MKFQIFFEKGTHKYDYLRVYVDSKWVHSFIVNKNDEEDFEKELAKAKDFIRDYEPAEEIKLIYETTNGE